MDLNLQNSQYKIKKMAMISIATILFIFGIINIIFIYYEQKQSIQESLEKNIQLTNRFFYSKIEKDIKILQSVSQSVVSDPEIVSSFLDGDRDVLYQKSFNYFNKLKLLDQHINNMHYYLPNTVSFLRMHKPEAFGDDLTILRPIVAKVNKDKIERNGFEVGRFGFYLRVTVPLYHNKIHIGALGLGLSLMTTLDDLKSINNSVNFIALPNKIIASEDIKSFRNMEDHIILKTRTHQILSSHKNDLLTFTPFLDANKNFNHEVVSINNKHYLINYSMKIKNFEHENIATVISIQDVSSSFNRFYQELSRIILLSIVSLLIVIFALNKSFNRYLEQNNELYKKYFQTRLKLQTINLKLNPHFIFNSLNVISELIYTSRKDAENNILRLSKLLRSYLSSTNKLTIRQELDFTKDYFDLQNTRFNEMHTIDIKIHEKSLLKNQVPKFSIQLLVENAFKHGIEDKKSMRLKIKVYRHGDFIAISVSNTGKGFKDLTKGFGLSNLELRLKEICDGQLTYRHRCCVTNFTIILKSHLQIQLHQVANILL